MIKEGFMSTRLKNATSVKCVDFIFFNLFSKMSQITISNTRVTEIQNICGIICDTHERTFSPTSNAAAGRGMSRQLSVNGNVNRRRQSEKKGNAK